MQEQKFALSGLADVIGVDFVKNLGNFVVTGNSAVFIEPERAPNFTQCITVIDGLVDLDSDRDDFCWVRVATETTVTKIADKNEIRKFSAFCTGANVAFEKDLLAVENLCFFIEWKS